MAGNVGSAAHPGDDGRRGANARHGLISPATSKMWATKMQGKRVQAGRGQDHGAGQCGDQSHSKTVSITDPELIAKIKACYTSGVSDTTPRRSRSRLAATAAWERMGIPIIPSCARAALRELSARLQSRAEKQAAPRATLG